MHQAPEVTIKEVTHGSFPQAAELNKKIDPELPILRVTVHIRWPADDPRSRLSFIENQLQALSPTFRDHQCRGLKRYRVFNGNRGGAGSSPKRDHHGIEPSLALAHLIEHAIIDFQLYITGGSRCSGATGALRDRPGHYDLLVECPDLRAGQCALALAVTWLIWAAGGGVVGGSERDSLAAARFALNRDGGSLTPTGVARCLSWSRSRAERALSNLCDLGCLGRSRFSMNFSDIPQYHVADPAEEVGSGQDIEVSQNAQQV